MELKLMMQMLRKKLWFLIVFVAVCTAGAGLYSKFMMTPEYEAQSTLIVNKMSADRNGAQSLDINEINSNIMLINSYKVIISSASIMDKVVSRFPEIKETSADLSERIKVVTTQNSQVITLKIRDVSYSHAMQIVNAVSQVFKEEIPQIMKIDNITILDKAKPESDPVPVSPNVKLNVAITFIASLMIAIGIAFLLDYLDDTVKTEQDVEKYLELTTLGAIRKMKRKDLKTRSSAKIKKQVGENYAQLSQ
ncbi:Wzz/FepE/Etk N-terminal domain-containing protein [Paenibacillus sp. VCA1]|uniref:YveK family protein n=1 Tax=Paenibacillus sp. VCA1 TaxID=3039148 RepID=UPI0028729417|nr:Wzz/FepE/Etk N-terminal domain-containing protein [Paenibacillus sp. VCA1]MDR9854400.1 Wzz/FepE/Etk N-terminal domain-containing protein [Paenibacillus sp. VCA1]